MDELLDSAHDALTSQNSEIANENAPCDAVTHDFAGLCRELWQQEKAQGNHDGKGFCKSLHDAGINVGRAYRAMKKFFPADFPVRRKPLKKKQIPTLFAANEVCSSAAPLSSLYQANLSEVNLPGLRFTSKPLPPESSNNQPQELLECTFAVTPQEKAEIMESLKLVDAAQVQRLFLQAFKQAAKLAAVNGNQSEIINNDAVCNTSAQVGAPAVAAPYQKAEIKNQKLRMARPAFSKLANCEGYVRLRALYTKLQMKGFNPDLLTLSQTLTPQDLQARLDWATAHPEWCAEFRGGQPQVFVQAFRDLPISA